MNNIFPELKRLHSPDLHDLENHSINSNHPFCILVQAMFGPTGQDDEESFDILVCNAQWVAQESIKGAFSGRHYIFVSSFDAEALRSFLTESAKQCCGKTWHEVAGKLGRIGKWEFEDYVD